MITRETRNNVTANNSTSTLATTVMENAYSICGKRIASVPVALMELDNSYQRVLGKTTKKLMAEWNNDKCDFLIVSYRNNRFYIIDGQHRYSVAKAKEIASLPCIIFTGLTQHDEARIFAGQQDNVNKLTPYDTFKANIACGNASIPEIAIDMEIKRVCDKYGIVVKKSSNKNEKILRCLGKVRRHPQNFEWIMGVINASNWANCPKAYTEKLYMALSCYRNGCDENDAIAEQRIISIMNSISPEELIIKSKYEYSEYATDTALNLCIKDLTKPSAN